MLAVFVNCAAIIVGSLLGLFFSKKITEQLSEMITTASGVVVLILGFQMAFKYQNIIYLALALFIGGVIGNAIDIDGKILAFGKMIERILYHKKVNEAVKKETLSKETLSIDKAQKTKPDFGYAFLNSSVLFCVGAMAIVGSFQAGVNHDYTTIFTKSILDGFLAIVFASSMGIGTAFSAVSILVYQGLLTLFAVIVSPFVSEQMIAEVTGSGGALIIMIGINMLGMRKIKVANFLPAIVITIIFVLIDPYLLNLFN